MYMGRILLIDFGQAKKIDSTHLQKINKYVSEIQLVYL